MERGGRSTQKINELLFREVSELVASGELKAAELLLLDSIKTREDAVCLSLLGRVYTLQQRTIDAAKIMQRVRLLQRRNQAFIEPTVEVEDFNNSPTDDDLVYIKAVSENLASIESDGFINDSTAAVDTSVSIVGGSTSNATAIDETRFEEQAAIDAPLTQENDNYVSKPSTNISYIDESSAYQEKDSDKAGASRVILKLTPRPIKESPQQGASRIFIRRSRGFVEDDRSDTSQDIEKPILAPESEYIEPYEQTSILHSLSLDGECDDDDHEISAEEIFTSPLETIMYGALSDDATEENLLLDDLQETDLFDSDEYQEIEVDQPEDSFRDLDDDYAAYVFDPEDAFDGDFFEVGERVDETLDRISREERALQKAAELIDSADWPHHFLVLVQQIFIMSGWGATRIALEREVEKGLSPDELVLAAHIKVIWAENDIYWISFDKTGSSRLSYYALSWPTALLIVRSFESLPQIEELEIFLEQIFVSWYESKTLRRAFKAFSRYLWFRFSKLQGALPPNEPFNFGAPHELAAEEYSDLGIDDELEIERTNILREYGVFQTKHPQEPSCYFSDKPVAKVLPLIPGLANEDILDELQDSDESSTSQEPLLIFDAENNDSSGPGGALIRRPVVSPRSVSRKKVNPKLYRPR